MLKLLMYGDSVDSTVEENSSVFSLIHMRWLQGHADSKTVHQQNPPVLNWRCQLMQVDLYNGRKTVVVVGVWFRTLQTCHNFRRWFRLDFVRRRIRRVELVYSATTGLTRSTICQCSPSLTCMKSRQSPVKMPRRFPLLRSLSLVRDTDQFAIVC